MFVRTATARDVAAIRTVLDASFHAAHDALLGPEQVAALAAARNAPELIAGEIAQPSGEFIVADDGRRIVGVAFASATGDGEAMTLHRLYVHPEHLGRGIGGLLMDEMLNAFPDARRCGLEVAAGNARAVSFYRGYGFEPVGTVPGDPAHVRMERVLGEDG
ncbi:MAG: GNAT family N-acetyltransferase [Rhizobiaceae bacterium]